MEITRWGSVSQAMAMSLQNRYAKGSQPNSGVLTMSLPKVTHTDTVSFSGTGVDWNARAKTFVDTHGAALGKLMEASSKAGYNLYTLGAASPSAQKNRQQPGELDDAYAKRVKTLQARYGAKAEAADNAVNDYKSNAAAFREAKTLRDKPVTDPLLKRQVELLYLNFFDGNVDKKMKAELIRREIELTTMYGEFRTHYKGEKLDDGKVESMLAKGTDPKEAEALWKAKHELGNFRLNGQGPTLAEKIIEAVKLRNRYAKKAGFDNFFEYGLFLNQMDPKQLDTLMVDVARVTEAPFQAVRAKLDDAAVKRWGISKTEARRPWFQAGVNDPNLVEDVYAFSPDSYLKGHDPRPLMKKMAGLMGHNVDKVVDRSDLFPRPGKSQHWYLFSLKTPSDIRSIGNVDPQFQDRMGFAYSTLLHEILGHGLGYSLVGRRTPPTLRDLHGITTETDAMMMENQVTNAYWLHRVLGMPKGTAEDTAARAAEYQAAHKLMSTVRFRLLPIIGFEREMYKNPDQDLNKLWAKTTKQFLGMDVPADRKTHDWTYKIHFATAPAYYPFYFFADLARAQVEATIKTKHGGMLTPATGNFLREQRKDGLTRHWTQIIEDMTGKPLGTEALANELAILTKK